MRNLRIRRKEKGFTCESLGKLINIQRSAVSKYERGEIQPSQETLLKLAQILDCTTDYLLGISNTPNPTSISQKETHNPYLIDTSELSAESKKELEKYIKLLKLADKAKNMNDEMEAERKFKPKYQN